MQKVEQIVEFPPTKFSHASVTYTQDTVVEQTCQKDNSHGHKLLALLKHQLHQTVSLKGLYYR